jgi:diguanylate cyclase (GGDEF)-like protein/PAS domain S-box-containing protein
MQDSLRSFRDAAFWMTVIVLMAICVNGVLTWQHFRQRDALEQYALLLASLRDAHARVTKGYLFLSRSRDPESPFDPRQGLALMDQAADILRTRPQQAPGRLDFMDPGEVAALHGELAGLAADIRRFRDRLERPARGAREKLAADIEARTAFLALERDTDLLEARIRSSLGSFTARQRLLFTLTIWISAAFSITILAAVVVATRRQKSAERKAAESERRLENILASLGDVVWSTSLDGKRMLYISAPAEVTYQRRKEEFFADAGLRLQVIHPDDREAAKAALERTASEGTMQVEYRIALPDGRERWLRDRAWVVRDEQGRPQRLDGIATDVTEQKAQERRIEFLAYYDVLTGLPNRLLLRDRIDHAISQARRDGSRLALLFLDLDGFKNVNDSMGHAAGDRLLTIVTERLRETVREQDTVARLGGDEFVVLIQDLEDTTDAAVVAQKILASVSSPALVETQELAVTASIGISAFPEDGDDADALIRSADAAMYLAKHSGRNDYRYFTRELNERAYERMRMENGLRHALARDEFLLHYQPQVDLGSGAIVGVEALLRWRHPDLGMIAPGRFIPVAEDTGLIVPIGEWVLHEACRQNRAWQQAGLPPIPIAVNLSAVQFRKIDCADLIIRALRTSGLDHRFLDVELTESATMDDVQQVLAALHRLKATGVLLSLDDFGTGYSSLSYLKRFPIDNLKIDRTFVRDTARGDKDAAITIALVNLAKSLGLRTIAEGVETAEELAFMRRHGCDCGQGYYFSPPLPVEEITRMLEAGQPPWSATFPHSGSGAN